LFFPLNIFDVNIYFIFREKIKDDYLPDYLNTRLKYTYILKIEKRFFEIKLIF